MTRRWCSTARGRPARRRCRRSRSRSPAAWGWTSSTSCRKDGTISQGLKIALTAERAQEDPHRITAVAIDVHGDRRRPEGSDSARHRPVAREVLLGVALHAAGHPVHDDDSPSGRSARPESASIASPGDRRRARRRRTYLDVLRGVAVLIMIEAHVIDSWTRAADRRSRAFGESMILGGFGAPLFLFLAGVAVAMSAGSKARRTGDTRAAVRAVQRRGLEIFAARFRLPLPVVRPQPFAGVDDAEGRHPQHHGPVDHPGGDALGRCSGPRARGSSPSSSRPAAVVWMTPIIRQSPSLGVAVGFARGVPPADPEPDQLHVFPLDGVRDGRGARRRHPRRRAEPGGGPAGEPGVRRRRGWLLAAAAYKASFLPPLGAPSSFWTTSASFFFIRLGLMIAALGLA